MVGVVVRHHDALERLAAHGLRKVLLPKSARVASTPKPVSTTVQPSRGIVLARWLLDQPQIDVVQRERQRRIRRYRRDVDKLARASAARRAEMSAAFMLPIVAESTAV